jgi:prephenate dehydrogenase
MQALVERMSAAIKPGAVVTDVGSVKSGVVRALEPLVRRAGGRFVGSHPMAGTERAGVRHARADLFEGAVCVLTPTAATCAEALRLVTALWRGVGGRIVALPAELHDELASRASHLPHLLAAALVNYVLDPAQPANQPDLCASGFRDTTRIASGSPEMWRDIALANREHLARVLQAFLGNLREFQQALEKGDEGAIVEYFKQAKQRRDAWVARCWPPERASGG